MTTFSQLKLSTAARPIVDRVLARATNDADRTRIQSALVSAAGADLNKVLSAQEVQAVADAFDAAGTGALTPDRIGLGLEGAHVALKSMSDLGNLDGVSNVFTLQGKSVETRMVKELQDAVVRANGRPMDVNMLIFEFQSDAMQKAITDIAKQSPNVTFRVIADSGQASATGGNALPELAKLGLPNIQVKFKKVRAEYGAFKGQYGAVLEERWNSIASGASMSSTKGSGFPAAATGENSRSPIRQPPRENDPRSA